MRTEDCGLRVCPMKKRVIFYPAFTDRPSLADQYYRALWYLYPLKDEIEEIEITTGISLDDLPLPDYLDGTIPALVPLMARKIVRRTGPMQITPEIDDGRSVILLWDAAREADCAHLKRTHCFVVDTKSFQEGDTYLEIARVFRPPSLSGEESARRRLERALRAARAKRVYLFGTGPGLALAGKLDFSDGVSVVCNSAVRDATLLSHVRPRFIVAADPVFHAGCSAYAQQFRSALKEALYRHDASLVIQARDAHVYFSALPSDLHERVIPIPVRYAFRPNLSLPDPFFATATRNVFTMFLLPLGSALADEICVLGCDGRPARERGYFWRHHESAQFTAEMSAIRQAHPGFFQIDYQDYYALHCETVRRWVRAAERKGKRVISLTPSHIPALAAREPMRASAWRSTLLFWFRCRAAYMWRLLQIGYGRMLSAAARSPRVLRILRAPVRQVRAALSLYAR